MTTGWRRRFAVALLSGGVTLGGVGLANDEDDFDDADLLEFIGSWEGDDDWLEILDAQDRDDAGRKENDGQLQQQDDDDGFQ